MLVSKEYYCVYNDHNFVIFSIASISKFYPSILRSWQIEFNIKMLSRTSILTKYMQ